VRVVEEYIVNQSKIARLISRTARYLSQNDPAVPRVRIRPQDVELVHGYFGPGYAHPTVEARNAVDLLARLENVPLETTYTGKAMAALLDYARVNTGSRLLFVDTFAENPTAAEGDYRDLPRRFWRIFDPSQDARCWCLRSRRARGFCWKTDQGDLPQK
jgi:hypothetical protein